MKAFDENHRLKKKNHRIVFLFLNQETVEMLCSPSLHPEPSTLFYNSTCKQIKQLSLWKVCLLYARNPYVTLWRLPRYLEGNYRQGLTRQQGHQDEHSQFLCNFNFYREITIWPKEGKTYCQLYRFFFFFLS